MEIIISSEVTPENKYLILTGYIELIADEVSANLFANCAGSRNNNLSQETN